MKEAPVMKVYSFSTPVILPVSDIHYRDKILKVSYPISLNDDLSSKMNYSYSLFDRGEYLNSRWSNNVKKLLHGNVVISLSQSKIFRVVVPFASDTEEDLKLESTIFDFSHHIRGDNSYAIVTLQCTLINSKTGELLKVKRFSYKENTVTTDAKGYAKATNIIIEKLNHDLIKWLH
jgi:cholesterol transport system auxiliary component